MAKKTTIDRFDPKLIDELIKDCKTQEDLFGEAGLMKEISKSLLERAMNAELTSELGYEKHDPEGHNSGNSRNGTTSKRIKTDTGELALDVPRGYRTHKQ